MLDPERHWPAAQQRFPETLPLAINAGNHDNFINRRFHTQAVMTRLLRTPLSAYLLLSCAFGASAHGGGEHSQIVVAPDADWPTRHMAGMGLYLHDS